MRFQAQARDDPEPLAPHPARADEARKHVEERAEVHHREPREDHAVHVRRPDPAERRATRCRRTPPARRTRSPGRDRRGRRPSARRSRRAASASRRRPGTGRASAGRSRRGAGRLENRCSWGDRLAPSRATVRCRSRVCSADDETVISRVISSVIRVLSSAAAGGMRILVIEDEPRILSFLTRGLEAEGLPSMARADGVDGARGCARARTTTLSSSTCCCRASTG